MSETPMTLERLSSIVEGTSCKVGGMKWSIRILPAAVCLLEHSHWREGWFVQLYYTECDVETGEPAIQHGRKWYISPFSTESEVVQTLLLAALTSAEHQVRENFLYLGHRIFGPHLSIPALVERASILERRAPDGKG